MCIHKHTYILYICILYIYISIHCIYIIHTHMYMYIINTYKWIHFRYCTLTPTFSIRTGKSPGECYCSQHPQWSQGGAWDVRSMLNPKWIPFLVDALPVSLSGDMWRLISRFLANIYNISHTHTDTDSQERIKLWCSIRHVQPDGKVIPESAESAEHVVDGWISQRQICQPYQTRYIYRLCVQCDARPRVSYSFHDLVPWCRVDSHSPSN